MQLTGGQRRPAQENDAIPKVAPKWLKHDRQVSSLFKSSTSHLGSCQKLLLSERSLLRLFYLLYDSTVSQAFLNQVQSNFDKCLTETDLVPAQFL